MVITLRLQLGDPKEELKKEHTTISSLPKEFEVMMFKNKRTNHQFFLSNGTFWNKVYPVTTQKELVTILEYCKVELAVFEPWMIDDIEHKLQIGKILKQTIAIES